jgi:hypothetical protein
MSVVKYNYVYKDGAVENAPLPSFYIATTFAELPVGTEGDTAYAKDNDKFYKYVTSWVEIGGGAALPGNIAYTDVANIFTQDQTITKTRPTLVLAPGSVGKGRVFGATTNHIAVTNNLVYDGAWKADDVALAGIALELSAGYAFNFFHSPVSANPRTLNNIAIINSGGLTLNQRELNLSGTGTAYTGAPLEIQTVNTPRVAFHWPGVIASQIGMGSDGIIRTFNNPGTAYEKFAALDIDAKGAMWSRAAFRQGLDPANGTGIATWFVESSNHLRAASGLYDYARGNPIGNWIAWTPVVVNDAGTGLTYGTLSCKYMLVGKTLFWQIYCDNITNSADSTYIRFTVPVAIQDGWTMHSMTRVYWSFQGHQVGYAYPTSANGTINVGRTTDGFNYWLGGTVTHVYQCGGFYSVA